jgi:hypothetical protein
MPYDITLYYCEKCGRDLTPYSDGRCPLCDEDQDLEVADTADQDEKDPFIRAVRSSYDLSFWAWLATCVKPRRLHEQAPLHIYTGAEHLKDGTLDWVSRLEQTEDVSFIEDTLKDALKRGGCLKAREACEALAAAEVVADLNQSSIMDSVAATEGQDSQYALKNSPLLQLAVQVLDQIKSHSEITGMWGAAGYAAECYRVVDKLEAWLQR